MIEETNSIINVFKSNLDNFGKETAFEILTNDIYQTLVKSRQDTLKKVREKIEEKKNEPSVYWTEEYKEGWRNVCDDLIKELEGKDE